MSEKIRKTEQGPKPEAAIVELGCISYMQKYQGDSPSRLQERLNALERRPMTKVVFQKRKALVGLLRSHSIMNRMAGFR